MYYLNYIRRAIFGKLRLKRCLDIPLVGSMIFLIMLFARPALAHCILESETSYVSITLPDNLSIPVNARYSPGDILWDSQWVPGTSRPRSHCYSVSDVSWPLTPLQATSFPNVYQTAVPGIGIRAYVNEVERPLTHPARIVRSGAGISYGPQSGAGRVQLIYTGPVTSGQFQLPVILGAEYYGEVMTTQLSLNNNNASVTAGTCEVTTPNINVSMPAASTENFPAAGSSYGRTPFSIGINCNSAVGLNVTLTDSSSPGNDSDILSLTPGSSARGIGYRIAHSSSIVRYGPDSSLAGNPNQIHVGTASAAGHISIPFTIEYVSTDTVRAGSANAMATFTMSYQ